MGITHAEISKMLEVAIVAARMAGQRAMEEIKYTKSSVKHGNEIVTEADKICQDLIINRIKETYPDHGFIAEEGPDEKELYLKPRTEDAIWWVIDPIDGTNNYAHGLLDFAISIAAFYNSEPIVGVIFAPATDSMFTAAKESDAQLNGSRISVTDEDLFIFASVAVGNHFPPDMTPIMHRLTQKMRFRNLGSTCLHLAYVASGGITASVTSSAKLWDIAAGAFIVETAGGIATDFTGKRIFPIDVENDYLDQFHIVTANKTAVHAEIVEDLG
jgi:myo-inositol-1(or 4)-monophosphatase